MNQEFSQTRLISFLEKIEIPQEPFEDEGGFIDYIVILLKNFKRKYKYGEKVKKLHKSYLTQRKLEPDIVIGLNRIVIEVKYNSDLNGIYRLYYQAFKYRKIAKDLLILYNYSSKKKGQLTEEEIDDLERNIPPYRDGKPIIKVIQRIR